MKRIITISPLLIAIFISIWCFFVFVYSLVPLTAKADELNSPSQVIQVKSIQSLQTFFEDIGYLETNWMSAEEDTPRVIFEGITASWATQIKQLSTANKKSVFFRLMTPLVLMSNEHILAQRKIVETAPLDSKALIDIAIKYRITSANMAQIGLTEEQRKELLERVDIVPPSLAIVQAAKESGWGTSRFAQEGNALFGQWDFTGQGIKPLLQREELGDYSITSFSSPLASVEGYMLNLNINEAYLDMRVLRAKLRAENRPVQGGN